MRATFAAVMILASTATAWAGKPTQAQAKKAATAWLTALKGGDEPDAKALAPLTATPFASMAEHDDESTCPATNTPSADKLGDVFDCLRGAVDEAAVKAKVRAYKKHDLGTQYDAHVKAVAGVKDAMVLRLSTECAGTDENVVIAVVKDATGAIKVAGVYVQSETCGE